MISWPRVRLALTLGLLFAGVSLSQKAHPDWRRGELVAIKSYKVVNPLERDWTREVYEYTLDGGQTLYIADFDTKPLRTALHDPIQFTIQEDRLVVMDKNRMKRAGSIRARVLK